MLAEVAEAITTGEDRKRKWKKKNSGEWKISWYSSPWDEEKGENNKRDVKRIR